MKMLIYLHLTFTCIIILIALHKMRFGFIKNTNSKNFTEEKPTFLLGTPDQTTDLRSTGIYCRSKTSVVQIFKQVNQF